MALHCNGITLLQCFRYKIIYLGRCDFAPAWLKLASSSTSSQSRSLSSTSQNHTHSSFSTPRARTPNGFDFDQGSGRSTQGNSTSNTGAVSRNSEGGKGGIGGRPSFPVSGGRVYSDNVVRASVNGNNSAQPGYERSLSEQHHPYVRRQKSLDSFGRQDPAARRSPPPPSGELLNRRTPWGVQRGRRLLQATA
jgi:hypothetical protein